MWSCPPSVGGTMRPMQGLEYRGGGTSAGTVTTWQAHRCSHVAGAPNPTFVRGGCCGNAKVEHGRQRVEPRAWWGSCPWWRCALGRRAGHRQIHPDASSGVAGGIDRGEGSVCQWRGERRTGAHARQPSWRDRPLGVDFSTNASARSARRLEGGKTLSCCGGLCTNP